MKLNELLAGVPVTVHRTEESMDIKRLCCDSRKVCPGDAFFALPGVLSDGHDYVQSARAAGACLIVAERDNEIEGAVAVTPDTHKALAMMAANFHGHPAASLRMTGVTGTNGKTTVTHILKGIYERVYGEPVGLIGTNAIRIGTHTFAAERTTPDAIGLQSILHEMVDAGCKRCVMEVSSHALAQARTWGIQYNQGLFLNLTQDHLDYHRDMEDYFTAKAQLFAQSDVSILNLDDEYGRRLAQTGDNTVTFSARENQADVTAKNIRLKRDRVEFEAVTTSQIARIEWATPGLFSVYNALAAVTAALTEGLSLHDISAAIREVPPVGGRMEVVPGPPDVTIVIDYAHTPDAISNLLSAARGTQDGRIITLFGCGGDRDHGKRPLMAQAAARGSDLLVVTSDNPRNEKPMDIINDILAGLPEDAPDVIVEENRVEAIARALREARPGDLVLLCGKGHETYQEIGGQRFPLDERTVISELVGSTAKGNLEYA